MLRSYIATFYSHFGAIRFKKELEKTGITAKVMPVPRNLSSSCGSCVSFLAADYTISNPHHEIEQIVIVEENTNLYKQIYKAADS